MDRRKFINVAAGAAVVSQVPTKAKSSPIGSRIYDPDGYYIAFIDENCNVVKVEQEREPRVVPLTAKQRQHPNAKHLPKEYFA